MSNIITDTYYSQNFELINEELRRHFKLANKEIDKVKDKVNELVLITHNDNKKWSLSQICKYIAGKNDDLEEFGFSAKTIERYLTEENKRMLTDSKHDPTKNKNTGTNSQKNVPEQGVDNCPLNVPEQSSSNLSYSSDSDDDNNTTTTPQPEHEDLTKYDDDLQKRVWLLEQRILSLEEDRKKLEAPYDVQKTIQIRDQEIPIIIHVDPYKRTAWPEIDEITIKKMGLARNRK